jgi:hypothetical protein
MELIARISVRRYELGEAGADAPRQATSKRLAIFRVRGKASAQAMHRLSAELLGAPGTVIVLALAGEQFSEDEKRICMAAMEHGIRRATPVVFCGGNPNQIFGRLAVDGRALKWFPSVPDFIVTHEIDGGRPTAHHGR